MGDIIGLIFLSLILLPAPMFIVSHVYDWHVLFDQHLCLAPTYLQHNIILHLSSTHATIARVFLIILQLVDDNWWCLSAASVHCLDPLNTEETLHTVFVV